MPDGLQAKVFRLRASPAGDLSDHLENFCRRPVPEEGMAQDAIKIFHIKIFHVRREIDDVLEFCFGEVRDEMERLQRLGAPYLRSLRKIGQAPEQLETRPHGANSPLEHTSCRTRRPDDFRRFHLRSFLTSRDDGRLVRRHATEPPGQVHYPLRHLPLKLVLQCHRLEYLGLESAILPLALDAGNDRLPEKHAMTERVQRSPTVSIPDTMSRRSLLARAICLAPLHRPRSFLELYGEFRCHLVLVSQAGGLARKLQGQVLMTTPFA